MEQLEAINHLVETSKRQSEAVDGMIKTVEHLEKQVYDRPTKRSAYGVSLAIGFVTLLIVGFLAFQLLNIADTNKETLSAIQGCVTAEPESTCFEDSQARTGEAVASINCETQMIIAYVIFNSEQPEALPAYPFTSICIPSIEERLNIDIPEPTE
jgi:hypothetical protein